MNNPPPTTRLATPRSYLDLQIPMGDDSDLGWGIEADVCDCFYNFVNPRTASMFGIDHPMSVAQWVQSGWRKIPIFDDDGGCNFTPSDETLVYPVFQGLCMGWSWALFFAQQAVSFIAAGRIERPINEVRDRMPMPDIQQQPCVGVYVDNIAIVGLQQDDVQQAADRVETYFREANIPLAWTSNKPLQVFETVGMVIDFKRRIIRNKPSRLWRAFLSGREILKRGRISVKLLERWLGHMTAVFMLAPYGLSCFFHIYKFIADNRDKRAYIWDSVRTEMRLALGVMWLARSSIQFDPIRQVDVGDSSTSAFALLTTFATHNEIRDAVRWREVWRFCAMPDKLKEAVRRGDRQEIINLLEDLHEPPSDEQGVVRPGIPWGAGLMTQYAQWLTETIDDSSWLRTSAIRSQFRAKVRRRIQVDVPALVPPISDELCRKSRFTLLWRKRWRNSNTHINVKEARVAVSSLKRTARVKQLHNKLKLTLTDNMAGLCALERGRSSSFQLNLVCRSAAAYQFGSGIRWRLRHIETLRNPADEDSRFDKPDKKSKTSKPLAGDAVPDEEVHLTQNSSGPCLGMMTSPTPSSSSGTSNRQRNCNSKNHRKGVFLEIFSGTARLTAAVREAGFACAPAIDILYGSHHDLRRRATQLALLSWIKAGWISVVHLGTPCTVFSRARHCIRDTERAREKERVGLEFAWFTAEVIETCRQHNIKWSLENPRFSRLFEVPVLATSLRDSFVVDLDFCRYGEPYRKATRIHTNNPDLLTLKKGCNHKKHDIVLRGSERIIENGKKISVPKTKNAGAYPYELVKVWAQIIGPDLCLPHRDAQTNIAQCFQDLFAATTKGKYLSQSLQTASEIDPHFYFIKSGISTRHVKESGGNARKVKLTGVDIRGNSIRESLPKHLKLKALKVKNPTLCKYKECVDKFMEYASHKRWHLKNVDNTDKKLAEYFAELLESGAPFNTASYTLFGYILLKTDECVADKFLYPRARSALKGWSSRHPQSSRTGADPLIWYLIANHIADKSPPAAAALLLQLETYARPSEILKAKRRDVIAPASRACKYWGLIFGNSQFSEMTKAKQQDDTVLLDSLDRNYAPKVLKMAASHCAQDDQFLFGPISLAQYEDLFKQSRAAVGLASFSLTPHCVRHSGPSVDFLHRARSATEIQTRGRWKTQKSILRYQKPGQMLAKKHWSPRCENFNNIIPQAEI